MNESHASPGDQQFTVFGDVVTAKDGSGINFAKGDNNSQIISVAPSPEIRDPWEALGAELTRIRQRLEDDAGRAAPDDRDDALDALADTQHVLHNTGKDGADSQRKLKRRIKELIGVLAPVAEIVGGVAALEAILQHL